MAYNKQTRREMRFLQEREVTFTRTIQVHSPESHKPSSSPSPSSPPPDLEDWDDWDHLDNRNTNRNLNEFTYKTPLELIEEYEPMFTSTTKVTGTGTGTGTGYGKEKDKDKDNDKKPEFKFTTRFCPCSDYRYCKRCGPTSG